MATAIGEVRREEDGRTVLVVSAKVFREKNGDCANLLLLGKADEVHVTVHGTPKFKYTLLAGGMSGKLAPGPIEL